MAPVAASSIQLFAGKYQVTNQFRDLSVPMSAEIFDDTRFGDLAKKKNSGMRDGGFSASGYWSGAANEIDQILSEQFGAANLITATFGDTVGDRARLMSAVENKWDILGKLGGQVAVNLEADADGGVWAGVVLHRAGVTESRRQHWRHGLGQRRFDRQWLSGHAARLGNPGLGDR
jgi:hypothetical protein